MLCTVSIRWTETLLAFRLATHSGERDALAFPVGARLISLETLSFVVREKGLAWMLRIHFCSDRLSALLATLAVARGACSKRQRPSGFKSLLPNRT